MKKKKMTEKLQDQMLKGQTQSKFGFGRDVGYNSNRAGLEIGAPTLVHTLYQESGASNATYSYQSNKKAQRIITSKTKEANKDLQSILKNNLKNGKR